MKRHKKDRYESPQLKRKKNKTKKKKKEKKIKKFDLLSSNNISDGQSDYCSSPKKIKEVNIKISKYSDKKSMSKEVSYVLKNNLVTKRIDSSLPTNIQKNLKSRSPNKLASLRKFKEVKMSKNLLHSNLISHLSKHKKTFSLSAEKKRYSKARNISKSRSRSKYRSRSISRSRFNLYYCKHSSKRCKRKSTSCDKYSYKKKIVSCKYKESKSSDKSLKISYSQKNSISPELNFNRNRCSKVHEESNNISKHHSSQVLLNYSSLQKHYDRYRDILREVKKILKKDAISKRKLKYILKRQQVYVRPPYIKLRSSSEDEFYIPGNNLKHKDIENQIQLNSLKYFHNGLTSKAQENVDKLCAGSTNSIIQESKMLCSETSLFNKKSTPSTLISNINVQSNITSRTPSPALPLVRDEAVFHKNKYILKDVQLNQLPLKKNNVSDKLIQLHSSNKCENKDNFSKYLNIEYNTSNQNLKSSNSNESLNPILTEKVEDLKFSNNTDINYKETFSFYRLSSSSQSTSFSRSLTPFRNSSGCRPWSQIFLLQNKRSNVVLKEDIKYSKSNEEILARSIQSSPSKTSSASELSRSRTPHLETCLKNLHHNYRTRSRSISFSKTSRSLSRSISRTSRGEQKRSCSKSSTHTFISSARNSRRSYSCSSRSTTFSSRISRPASSNSTRSRSTSIPRRHGSPSFLDRRRITSARKRPIPYHRPTPSPLSSTSSIGRSNCSGWSPQSNKSSRTPSYSSPYLVS